VSWWVLGRGLLDGTIDTGWLWAWGLLLVSLIPFRLVASRMQGMVAVSAGAWLRRRLLRGAMRIDRQDVRRHGPGQFFGLVIEAGAVESLALGGGVMALLALLELGLTALVLWAGAGPFAAFLLALWTTGAFWVASRYVKHRRTWTRQRLSMTDRLLQCMVGHRTRLAQLPVDQWHKDEDESLNQYLESGKPMDRANLWLTAIVPRGWLMVAVAALTPALAAASSAERMAVTVGGILLGYRGLRRLSIGLSSLAGAAIAGHAVRPLVRAASRRDAPTCPSLVVRSPRRRAAESEDVLAQAREVSFRYPTSRDPVLHGCNLRVARGARLLLEGPSGTGKTTLATVLAGLQPADSGVVLVNGLDHSVLGRTGWHSRVVMAPQPHDNYLVSGTLAFNLLMGRRWPAQPADLAEAEKVCRELGLGDLLDRMPAGLQQVVGETGWQLSQGERTRVFLARAVLQQPELLILDESWGSLDPENVERAVRCVTQRAPAVIAVAH
jgi:ATP-binding cassette subfamily B protein